MSDMEETASNDPNSPERERSRSPRNHSPPPQLPPPHQDAAVEVVADLARRTCPVCMRLFDSAKAMWGHSWVHRERRDQIYAMNPPIPPPPLPPANGSAMAVGGGGGGGGAGWHPWKIDSLDERDRTCPRCMKVFGSPKAMFGHLHVHYEKAPKIKGEPVAGPSRAGPSVEVPPADMEVPPADVEVPPMDVEANGGDNEDSPVTSIDLNRPPREAEGEEVRDDGDDIKVFDLNMTPPSS